MKRSDYSVWLPLFSPAFICPMMSASSELVNSDRSRSRRLELLIVCEPKAVRSSPSIAFVLQNMPLAGRPRILRVMQLKGVSAVFFLSAQLRQEAPGFAFKLGDFPDPRQVSCTASSCERLLFPSEPSWPEPWWDRTERDLLEFRTVISTVVVSVRHVRPGRLPLTVLWLPVRIVPYGLRLSRGKLLILHVRERVDCNKRPTA